MPRIVSGSSVGSIIAAIICSRKYEEISEMLEVQQYIDNPLLKYKVGSITELLMNLI